MEKVDVVVIGAGWHGLVTAKTFLQVHPSSKLVLLESAPTVGGVWAKHRLYPGLKSNNMIGTYEYSDFPMDPATYGVKKGEHIPGDVIHRYLHDYGEQFDLYRWIHFNSKVETIAHNDDDSWIVTVAGKEQSLHTSKLVLATGLTSEPFLPTCEGSSNFNAPFFHTSDQLYHTSTLLKRAESVTVLGGTKSAWDAAYQYAAAGVSVDWVIRESGHGPVWMAPAYVTPLKLWLEKLVHTRFLTWFSPCILGDADGFWVIRKFLHGTHVGRWLVDGFWKTLRDDLTGLNAYDKHSETAKLKPWLDPFWVAASLSILNYSSDIFNLVKSGNIKVHIADITHLSHQTVHLSSGATLPTDALICATGWKHRPSITFLPEGIERDLGLPTSASVADPTLPTLARMADAEIMKRFPKLKDQPLLNPHYKPLSGSDAADNKIGTAFEEPFRLWRFMVPPAFVESRSITFNGMVMNISTALVAQTQALWITAYLDGTLSLPTPSPTLKYLSQDRRWTSDWNDQQHLPNAATRAQEVKWETMLQTQFIRWRYPGGFGIRFPEFVFDAVPYLDMLLKDLGLRFRRKGALWKEIFQPYAPIDYAGLVDEWKVKLRNQAERSGFVRS